MAVMDPSSGTIYGGEARAALEKQSAERPKDKPLKRLLKRLIPLGAKDLAAVESMNIWQRKGWAKARNERKRVSRARRGVS